LRKKEGISNMGRNKDKQLVRKRREFLLGTLKKVSFYRCIGKKRGRVQNRVVKIRREE